jgi:hypothetical protein
MCLPLAVSQAYLLGHRIVAGAQACWACALANACVAVDVLACTGKVPA